MSNSNIPFSYEQYQQWSADSKNNPLPTQKIDLCNQKVEVFALPGYKEKPGHYIYSGTSATDVAQKTKKSLWQFLRSKSSLAAPHKDFSFGHFAVEKSDLAIIGYPSTVVFSYWVYQLSKGNLALVPILNALGSTSLDLMADKEFNVNRTTIEYNQLIKERLFTQEAVEYKIHFYPGYYNELYRIFQKRKTGKGRPGIFAQVTRDCFYTLFPGQANDLFDERNADKSFYNHQFLSEDGNKTFDQIMTSFLTFLRGCQPGNWDSFLVQYQNVYGSGFQGKLGL